MVWAFVILAAFGLGGFTARTALERGRSGTGWAVLSAVVWAVGLIVGVLLSPKLLGPASLSIGAAFLGAFASVVLPLAGMLLVLGAVMLLPERVPSIGGRRWPMYRMSTKDAPGGDCELSFEDGQLRVGDHVFDARALGAIETDGECLRLAWGRQSLTLLPIGKERTPRMRAKQSQAIRKRLTKLLGRA